MRVIIESPYAGDVEENLKYAREALLDSILHEEEPLASHLLYTQVLDDNSSERELGMQAGFTWYEYAEACIAYLDRGLSPGMERGIAVARSHDIPVIFRMIRRGPMPEGVSYFDGCYIQGDPDNIPKTCPHKKASPWAVRVWPNGRYESRP